MKDYLSELDQDMQAILIKKYLASNGECLRKIPRSHFAYEICLHINNICRAVTILDSWKFAPKIFSSTKKLSDVMQDLISCVQMLEGLLD